MGVFRHKGGDISYIPGPDYPASDERVKAEQESRKAKLCAKYEKFSREDLFSLLEMHQRERERLEEQLDKWKEWFSWAANETETGVGTQVAAGSVAS